MMKAMMLMILRRGAPRTLLQIRWPVGDDQDEHARVLRKFSNIEQQKLMSVCCSLYATTLEAIENGQMNMVTESSKCARLWVSASVGAVCGV